MLSSTTCYHISTQKQQSRPENSSTAHTHTGELLNSNRQPHGRSGATRSRLLILFRVRIVLNSTRAAVIPILGLPNACVCVCVSTCMHPDTWPAQCQCQCAPTPLQMPTSLLLLRARARAHTHTHTHTHYIQHGPWSRSAEDDEPATPWATCTRMHR